MISFKKTIILAAFLATSIFPYDKVFLVNSASEIAYFNSKSLRLEIPPFSYYEIDFSEFSKILESDSWRCAQIITQSRTFDFYFDKTIDELTVGYCGYRSHLGGFINELDIQLFIFIKEKDSSSVPLPAYDNIEFLFYKGYPDLASFDKPELAMHRDLFFRCKKIDFVNSIN